VQNVTYFEVEIAIEDEAAGLLRPRMSGDADIVAEVVEEALSVPETALRYGGAGISVGVVVNGDATATESRPVKIGIVDGSRVQILEGVAEGDEVLLQ
jgi:multidrug efflux pump subunit AcrA (membrane-fusion protein)